MRLLLAMARRLKRRPCPPVYQYLAGGRGLWRLTVGAKAHTRYWIRANESGFEVLLGADAPRLSLGRYKRLSAAVQACQQAYERDQVPAHLNGF